MKQSPVFNFLLMLFTGCILVGSCKPDHNIQKRNFSIRTTTFYRLSPIAPTPIVVNSNTFASFAYFPGSGAGNASHVGECSIYFNQLTYGTSPQDPPAGSVAAPVVDIPGYPVTGAPLPLIQPTDFEALPSVISSLSIPASVYGKVINTVILNKKGEVIFLSAVTGSGTTFPLSATKVGFNGKALIVTGRGKFDHAVGEVDYSGYFNITDANDAEFNAEGWINY
jgi:hypothetical protein